MLTMGSSLLGTEPKDALRLLAFAGGAPGKHSSRVWLPLTAAMPGLPPLYSQETHHMQTCEAYHDGRCSQDLQLV